MPDQKSDSGKLHELQNLGLIDGSNLDELKKVSDTFKISITPEMLALIEKEGGTGPISSQFIPDVRELIWQTDELGDPIGDHNFEVVSGLTHRYPDRVLFKITQSCQVYCRFCFRRESVGQSGVLSPDQIEAATDYIRNNPRIWEVVLSGGDPLAVSHRRISSLIKIIGDIDHVKCIRIHTRVPVVRPKIISKELIGALNSAKATYVVVHVNHASEITDDAKSAVRLLAQSNISVLSQTVLLKGINDKAEILADLFRTLVGANIKPYYLHHTDLARGTSHFRVSISRGIQLMRELRGAVSGICLPTYVLDIPGGFGKVPINHQYLTLEETGKGFVEDPNGLKHQYEDNGL